MTVSALKSYRYLKGARTGAVICVYAEETAPCLLYSENQFDPVELGGREQIDYTRSDEGLSLW